jgi:hypothetical protein
MPIDCGQDGICAVSPGCMRHWHQRARELFDEREELRKRLDELQSRLKIAVECNESMREPMRQLREATGMWAQSETSVINAIVKDRELLRALLREVYEAQQAACIGPVSREPGKAVPCKKCLWCRVRELLAHMEGLKQ